MSIRVIDLLEVIDVEDQRDSVRRVAPELSFYGLLKAATVGEGGQMIFLCIAAVAVDGSRGDCTKCGEGEIMQTVIVETWTARL